jgi:hypothetical protein
LSRLDPACRVVGEDLRRVILVVFAICVVVVRAVVRRLGVVTTGVVVR